jgi:hypothetical protein
MDHVIAAIGGLDALSCEELLSAGLLRAHPVVRGDRADT